MTTGGYFQFGSFFDQIKTDEIQAHLRPLCLFELLYE